jgi:plastocyanin
VGETVNDFRKRVLGPAMIPVGAFVFIGALVFGFSRLLLVVPKDGAVILGVLLAASILFGAGALSKGRSLKSSQRTALLAAAILLIGGGVAAGTSIHTREVEGNVPVAAELTAKNIRFDKPEITLPADEPVAILFHNEDPGVVHNVAIFDTPELRKTFLRPPTFPGIATRKFDLKNGLPKGVYFFHCDAHPPQMNGRVLVGGATAPPAPVPSVSGPPPSPTSPITSPAASAGPPIALVAKNTSFDKKTLTFAGGSTVAIDFDNQDPGQLHNFALYKDSSATTKFFSGPFTTGPEKRRYEFPAPAPGTYFFRCDVHPTQMFGTAVVS